MKKLNIFKCYHLIETIWRIVIKMNIEYSLKGYEILGMCTPPPKDYLWLSSLLLINKYMFSPFRGSSPLLFCLWCYPMNLIISLWTEYLFSWIIRQQKFYSIIPYFNSHFKNLLHVFISNQILYTPILRVPFFLTLCNSKPTKLFLKKNSSKS